MKCIHGYYGYCPHGCHQTQFEQLIADVLGTNPSTEEGIKNRLTYKQAVARERTADLSITLKEIADLEEQLAKIRSKEKTNE